MTQLPELTHAEYVERWIIRTTANA